MKISLPDLINYDQTGFIKGRFIGEKHSPIDSVICYAKEKNIAGLLLFLDFEKAFDTIEWPFIVKTFQHFGFDNSILKWLNLFYCRPESCVLNNGWASNFFEIQRGVRQGCPLSPYLFVLSVEVLAKAIRENHTNAKVIKEVNKLFFSFLWNGKGDKIKRDININDYSNGCLKMIDIQSKAKSYMD